MVAPMDMTQPEIVTLDLDCGSCERGIAVVTTEKMAAIVTEEIANNGPLLCTRCMASAVAIVTDLAEAVLTTHDGQPEECLWCTVGDAHVEHGALSPDRWAH